MSTRRSAPKETSDDDHRRAGLRPLAAGDRQRGDVHHLRVQLLQATHTIAVTGAYAQIRHPQYVGFVLIMVGFLLQWPTLITLVVFPILVTMYVRRARREEREALAEFGDVYAAYAVATHAFIPRRPSPSRQPRDISEEQQSIGKEHHDAHIV